MSRKIKIASQQRMTGSTSSSSFTIYFNQSLKGKYRLFDCLIPNTVYNVNSTNNKIYFTDSQARTGTITSGFYTTSTIGAAIQTAMNAVSSGYTVAYSSTTGLLTFSNASSFSFTFGTNTSNSSRYILGFNASDTTSSTSITAPNVANLALPLSFNISLNGLVGVENAVSSYSFSIPILTNTNEITYFTVSNGKCEQVIDFYVPANTLSVNLIDESGNNISLNGSEWYMTLEGVE